MPVTVSEKRIKSKIKSGDRTAVIENIKYPFFEGEKSEKLCKRMNDFYSDIAEKYSYHARIRLPKRIKSRRVTCRLPMTVTMNYTIAFCDENIISVVLDLSFSEGKNIKMRRFSQMWGVERQDMLSPYEIIRTDGQAKKSIYRKILSIAKENGENPAFGYVEDYPAKLSKHFDLRNVFVVPKGVCFFVNAGILSPEKYGASNFILSFESLKGLMTADFLTDKDIKEPENKNIVNNI